MPITPSLRHCSNKYKLAREGEKEKEKEKDKDEDFEKVNYYYYFCIIIQSVKDLSSNFVKVEVDRQYIDVDEDAYQFWIMLNYLIFRKWINL